MRPILSKPQSNKVCNLPVGVSSYWRHRKGRRPVLVFAASYSEAGRKRVKSFYCSQGAASLEVERRKNAAIAFRQGYEETVKQRLEAGIRMLSNENSAKGK